ncbi:hypothetical protein BRC81_01435 [Halobacteriales archaeon QS_1_68_20]|nr:MAG: hypothetical protein BRC81_01435 [Halobacteriales archaeon QS_1_68_20]
MTQEPRTYRAWKALVRRLSRPLVGGDQHERLRRTDWDVLVVLDACRLDAFRQVANWPVEGCTSPASSTDGWLDAATESGVFEDATVVTSNSRYAEHDLGLRDLHPLWEDAWVDRLGNVTPEPVLDRVDELVADGRERVVGHVGPPHAPYVARVDGEWLPVFPEVTAWHWNPEREAFEQLSQQAAMASGVVDLDRAARGYHASVRSVWEVTAAYVARMARAGATVVVTADHGETFGRPRDWWLVEHPARCYVPALTRVPFAVFADGERRGAAPSSVEEALSALGYAEGAP